MRTLLAVMLLASCGRSEAPPGPRTGAFAPERAVEQTAKDVRIAIDRTAVPLEEMPMGRWLAGLPMQGLANVKIDLVAPIEGGRTRYSRARGSIDLACTTACQIGDDIAKLALPNHELDVGHVDFDGLALRGVVEDGHATLTDWKVSSPDVKLDVKLAIALADDLAASTVEGCVRFAPAAGLDQRRPKTWAAVQLTGASKDAGGMFSIRLTGTLGAMKRLAEPCDAGKVTMN